MSVRVLRIPALEIRQSPSRVLYSFAADGKILHTFAAVSRVRRDNEHQLDGYQRPEVISHIRQIQRYLESEDPLLPNSIVVAFDDRVSFEASDTQPVGQGFTRIGDILVPIDDDLQNLDKPGWIVDGQQRSAAIRDAAVAAFPVFITAFIAQDDREQREQFILVNSTKPLPKGLIYELLPETETRLPALLRRRRLPAYLLQRLNFDLDSPLREMVRTPTNPDGVIKDNSILRMLEHSLGEGVLHRYRDPYTGEGDIESMLAIVKNFWGAVAEVFDSAWGLRPEQSRLMHGVGIVSLGFLMDAIAETFVSTLPSQKAFAVHLRPLAGICHWTEGEWLLSRGVRRPWNELQNTFRDIQLLADHLLDEYRHRVWIDHASAG